MLPSWLSAAGGFIINDANLSRWFGQALFKPAAWFKMHFAFGGHGNFYTCFGVVRAALWHFTNCKRPKISDFNALSLDQRLTHAGKNTINRLLDCLFGQIHHLVGILACLTG